ncbi:MAG: hypothetical protein HYU66_06510 [Armatimonadetes bacterium]|nr:hypothetical protein [Armatimonadota bacterium]
MGLASRLAERTETPRVLDLRRRVRAAMERPPVRWDGPARLPDECFSEPLAVRKAAAVALKLAHLPTDLWAGQLFAGSFAFEEPRLHTEWSFPDYLTDEEREEGRRRGLGIHCFGHIVPDYPRLLRDGLLGIRDHAARQLAGADEAGRAFLDSVTVAIDGVLCFAVRLAERCEADAASGPAERADELRGMAADLRVVPAHPAGTFHQALQSVWLLHMVFHTTMDANAVGRLDQYAARQLEGDLDAGRLTLEQAAELVDCFCLKFNERAATTEEQRPEHRGAEAPDPRRRTRHSTSSQLGTRRDSLDATNHWLQNIVVGGSSAPGHDQTTLLTHLLLDSYRRNQMTNPLLTVRLHDHSPGELLEQVAETLKDGGGMPAMFNDEALVPALERLGIEPADAADYSNDGCWEVILPGRTDFRFQRLSLMLCLEAALNRGQARLDGAAIGPDTGDPRAFTSFDEVWTAFEVQLDAMVARMVDHVVASADERSTIAPVPLLSALTQGCLESRRDLTAGGAKYRTFGMLAESASHCIDSLAALRSVVFERRLADTATLCDALDADFEGHELLRKRLQEAPKYGNDEPAADELGRRVMETFIATVERHAARHATRILFPCGAGTFSWYLGIGEGLGSSPDGRQAGEPVASNFSPALGQDRAGLPAAILSYAGMPHARLPAGGPLDLRLGAALVRGEAGTARMVALIRGFVEARGSMLTLTVADVEELRAAQREPERYASLRVRMGGWCAYFTMLGREQQEHHIRRQGGGR